MPSFVIFTSYTLTLPPATPHPSSLTLGHLPLKGKAFGVLSRPKTAPRLVRRLSGGRGRPPLRIHSWAHKPQLVNKTLRFCLKIIHICSRKAKNIEFLQLKVAKSNIFLLQFAKNGCMMIQVCESTYIKSTYIIYMVCLQIKHNRRTL